MLAHHVSSTHFSPVSTPPSSIPTTTKRRKPTLTYRAPTSVQKTIPLAQPTSTSRSRPPSNSQLSSSAPSPLSKWSHTPEELPSLPSSSRSSSSSFADRDTTPRPRDRHSSSFLPLYHPFGPLALSLPPLDPIALGLPISPRLAEALEDSLRSRKQGNRAFSSSADPTPRRGSEPVEVVPERSSPRKRRTNGSSGGGASKRRRKETTEGDAAYPAKRTRSNKARSQSFVPDVDPEGADAMAIRPGSSGSEDAVNSVAAPNRTAAEEAARRLLDLESGSDAALDALSHQAEQGLASLMSNLDQALVKLVSASPE
ncbi:hypothetical protein BDV98DRAFT_562940 [Pterulicium gracile]|uniref:Uncharacterized protein n=1 Tax=Pterulicium gracile TaxID=1884261 RepID=A0A5C3QS84_9AGAR|nr:hypothetical protein BDV98DRAFT_562940 [Pterula gracilis]